MTNEPYYEKHRFMSVMFATIVHDDMERIDLRLMNEMICDFDDVVNDIIFLFNIHINNTE